jgi:integrase
MGPSEEQSGNVGQKILGDKRAHAVLTEQEIKVLLEECEKQITSPWLLPLVTLALHTGMRQGELLTLKWENIDFDRGSITIIQGKTLRRKTIAINEPAREALEWLQENCYGDLLFLWPWGDPIGKVTVYDAFKKAQENKA